MAELTLRQVATSTSSRMLASYYRICTEAGVEPLPDDEAREQATALMAVLVPAFEVTRRGVQVALTSAQEYS